MLHDPPSMWRVSELTRDTTMLATVLVVRIGYPFPRPPSYKPTGGYFLPDRYASIAIGKNGKIEDTFASITKPTSKKFISALEKALD